MLLYVYGNGQVMKNRKGMVNSMGKIKFEKEASIERGFGTWTFKKWSKNGMNRIYANCDNGKKTSAGYIDLETKEIHTSCDSYDDLFADFLAQYEI